MLVFPCSGCGAVLRMADEYAGKKASCPTCKAVTRAPAAATPADEAITAAPVLPPPVPTVEPAPPMAVIPAEDVPSAKPRRRDAEPIDAEADDEDDRPRRRRRRGRDDEDAPRSSVGKKAGLGIGLILLIVGVCGCLVLGVLVALLVPAVQKVRESAARMQTMNNMKQDMLAVHNYHDTYKRFPAPKLAPPLNPQEVDLSWRVSILPYVEQAQLFNRFDKKSDWNSPQNLLLLNPRPDVYGHVGREGPPPQQLTTTYFQLFTGPNTLYPDNAPRNMAGIPDGTSNTFMFAEANNPVTWSKAEDMVVGPGPLPLPADRFLAAMADGSVRSVDRHKVGDDLLRLFIDPRDGQRIPPDFD